MIPNYNSMRNVYPITWPGAQQASPALLMRMLAGIANTPEPRLARARKIAAEVRARRTEMQVRKLDLLGRNGI